MFICQEVCDTAKKLTAFADLRMTQQITMPIRRKLRFVCQNASYSEISDCFFKD